MKHDKHINEREMLELLSFGRVYIAEKDGRFAGWLRYSMFWGNTPFMDMLYVLEEHRGRGIGTELVAFWEERMRGLGYETAMTSTVSDEYAQHLYYKLGYRAVGGFTPHGEPYELILEKRLVTKHL